MKIAQIVCAYPPYAGGIGQSAYRLEEILAREHEIRSFSLAPLEIKKSPHANHRSTNTVYFDPLIRLGHGALPFLLPYRLRKYNILYFHYPFFGVDIFILLLKIFRPKKKLVIHYHMDTPALPGIKKILSLPSSFIRKALLKRAEVIIVASRDYADNSKLSYINKYASHKIKVIPFGIETDIFKPKNKRDSSPLKKKASDIVSFVTNKFIKRGSHNLLFVGGLDQAHYFKGLNFLLEAMTKTKSLVNLRIVGEGDLQSQYEQEVLKLGLKKRVNFLGRLSEDALIYEYQTADLLILPSINNHEAFGLVLIEAMACGLPVIASDLPGVRSVFQNGREGLFCQPSNANDLANKIDEILLDEDKREKMSIAARILAEDRYSWEKIADSILDEFSKLN